MKKPFLVIAIVVGAAAIVAGVVHMVTRYKMDDNEDIPQNLDINDSFDDLCDEQKELDDIIDGIERDYL